MSGLIVQASAQAAQHLEAASPTPQPLAAEPVSVSEGAEGKGEGKRVYTRAIPDRVSGQQFYFSRIPDLLKASRKKQLKQAQQCTEAEGSESKGEDRVQSFVAPSTVTALAFDKSATLDALLDTHYPGQAGPASLMAELQFAFVAFYIGQNLDGQAKRSLNPLFMPFCLFCSSPWL